MISKIWKEYQVIIVMVPLIIGSHMGWKYLQDIGVGDKGRDYPIKKVPEVYGKVISEKLWPEKTDDEKMKCAHFSNHNGMSELRGK